MCWEDHEFIYQLVAPGDRVAMVCSAGDLALCALSRSPETVLAIDTNPDQLHLTRLKQTALEALNDEDYEDFMGFFSPSKRANKKRARKSLEQVRRLLDQNTNAWLSLHQETLVSGIVHTGRFERYLRSFMRWFFSLSTKRQYILQFLNAANLLDQQRIYEQYINRRPYRLLFRFFFGRFYMTRKGRHPDLLAHVKQKPEEVFYQRMEHSFCEVPIQENYFFQWILEGSWKGVEQLPFAFKRDLRPAIRANTDRLKTANTAVYDAMMEADPESFDIIYLSDATETMSEVEAKKLFDACRRVLKPTGKLVLWNNLVDRKPLYGWRLEAKESQAFWVKRKISFYGYFGIFIKE